MDPIRNLVAGADPLGPDHATPDPEAALTAMFSRPGALADRVAPDIPTLAERRRARARVLGAATLAAAAVAAGVLVATNLSPMTAPAPATTSVSTQAPSVRASASPAPTPSRVPSPTAALPSVVAVPVPSVAVTDTVQLETPAAGWERYSNQAAGVSFDLPPGWTVIEHSLDGATPAVRLDVANHEGTRVASLTHAMGGLGGACMLAPVPLITLDSQPAAIPYSSSGGAPAPEFVFRVLDGTGSGLGVTGSVGVAQPDPQLAEACMYYNTVSSDRGTLSFGTHVQVSAGGETGMRFGSVAEARAYMASAEYAQFKRMFLSLVLAR